MIIRTRFAFLPVSVAMSSVVPNGSAWQWLVFTIFFSMFASCASFIWSRLFWSLHSVAFQRLARLLEIEEHRFKQVTTLPVIINMLHDCGVATPR